MAVGAVPFHSIVDPTVDTTRLNFLMDLLVRRQKGVCLVGSAGTGKTTLIAAATRALVAQGRMHTLFATGRHTHR